MHKEGGQNKAKLIIKGCELGFIAGLLTALVDGFIMLLPKTYATLSYPLLLITINCFFWTIMGGACGFFFWLCFRSKNIQGKENSCWIMFFLFPFAVIYGYLGQKYISMKFWWPTWKVPVFDHYFSFLWIAILLVFIFFYLKKKGGKKELPAIFYSLEIIAIIIVFQICSNLHYLPYIRRFVN